MLDRDLATLAATGPEVSLAGLEAAIWSKVDVLNGQRRVDRLASRLQLAAIGVALIGSLTVGVKIAEPANAAAGVTQLSSAADLAPSMLFGTRR